MTLARDLRNLANQAPDEIPSVTRIEDRAVRLSRRKRAANAVALIAVVVVGVLAASQIQDLFDRSATAPVTEPPVGPLYVPTPTPTKTSCPLRFDACGDDEGLPMPLAQEWLGSILNSAGVEYTNAYRPDGGGGHLSRRWGFMISVFRPTEEIERAAARYEKEPLWSEGDTTVYGSQYETEDSSGAYFYWRAGGVDTSASRHWVGSGPPRPEDLRPVIARIIREQERNPFPYGSDK